MPVSFQRLFKRRHSSTMSRERTQRPGKKRGSHFKSPTVSTVFFDCIRPINRFKDRPFLSAITTHSSLHITEPTRHFRNPLAGPVPAIPGGGDSARFPGKQPISPRLKIGFLFFFSSSSFFCPCAAERVVYSPIRFDRAC